MYAKLLHLDIKLWNLTNKGQKYGDCHDPDIQTKKVFVNSA